MTAPADPNRPDPDRTTWVGRATPPSPPPPPTDPYWPPVEPTRGGYPDAYPAALVRPPRRRRTGRTVLFTLLGLFTLCCGGAVALAFSLNGGLPGKNLIGPAPPGLNTPVKDGQFTFVVTSVNCGQPSVGRSFFLRHADGQYCLVNMTVENTGESTQSFSDGFQKLIGADGTVYGSDLTAGVIANENISGLWTRIDQGGKVSGTVVFDVPKDARIVKVRLHDSALSGGIEVTL